MIPEGFVLEQETLARLRGSTLTQFNRQTADHLYGVFLKALDDRQRGNSMLRVSSAPTGSGKSSAAVAFLSYAFKQLGLRSVFVTETIAQADATYRDLKLLLGSNVVIWTSDHDETRLRLVSNDTLAAGDLFTKEDLRGAPVVVVTHTFLQTPAGLSILGERDLMIIDERPQYVKVFDLGVPELDQFYEYLLREECSEEVRLACASVVQLARALHDEPHGGPEDEVFIPLDPGSASRDLKVVAKLPNNRGVWSSLSQIKGAPDLMRNVVGFCEAASSGRAFLSRTRFHGRIGCRFVGYSRDFPIVPGMVLLDATSEVDRVSDTARWQALEATAPSVNYSRLQIIHHHTPAALRKRLSWEIRRDPELWHSWRDWLVSLVLSRTKPDSSVLLVAKQDLIGILPPTEHPCWQNRRVSSCHWGTGIGSNKWRECQTVILVGDFYLPKDVVIGTTLGLQDRLATQQALEGTHGRGLPHPFEGLQRGNVLRWIKQMACRGNVRNIDEAGTCGAMTLILAGDLDLMLTHQQALFPGSPRIQVEGVGPSLKDSRAMTFKSRLCALLLKTDEDCLTTKQVEVELATRLDGQVRWLISSDGQRTLAETGWRFIKGGRGRGRTSMFTRIEATEETGLAA